MERALRQSGLSFCIAASLLLVGCADKKPPRAFTPPPPQPPRVVQTQVPELAPGPNIEGTEQKPVELGLGGEVLPPPPAPPVRRPVAPPKAVVTTPPPETAPPPRLVQQFSENQLREYQTALDESLGRVNNALAVFDRKRLNGEQRDTVVRIRTFQKQAQQAREQDLVTAVSLAKRADLLAQDLLQRLR